MSNLAEITKAAIKSDMEHRGYTEVGGEFHKEGTYGAMGHVRIDYYVSHGQVRIETTGGELYNADEIAEDMRSTLDSEVFDYWGDEISDLFLDWIVNRPSAGDFAGPAETVAAGATELSPGPQNDDTQAEAVDYSPGNPRLAGDLSNLRDHTAHLQGHYAQRFASRYVAYLGGTIERQSSLAGVLAIVLRGERDIWERTETDFTELLTRAETAMRESSPLVGGSADAAKILLSVVGAVASVISAIPTAGGSLAIGAALVAGSAGVAGDLIKSPPTPEKTELDLAGSTPQAVRDKIKDELKRFGDAIESEERVLIDILADVNAAVAGDGARYFDLSEPSLNTATEDILDPVQVLVDDYYIGSITSLWLPTIAGDLRQARENVSIDTGDIWSRAAFIGYYYNGPKSGFEALQGHLVSVLSNTARELEDAADALLQAAKDIGLADETLNQEFRREADRINSTNDNAPPRS